MQIHSLELEVELLQGKLSTAGQDWETVKADMRSKQTDLEGKHPKCYDRVLLS